MTSATESPFSFHEIFYSKTNKHGIIQSGNSVFQRVSEYSWSELINKPHNIIRHSEMPKAVFHLLWEYLHANSPIGAFVKNKSKTGKYYWVFALAMPIDQGYLSVRIKPSGDLLKLIEEKYEVLRTIEVSQKISPHDSQNLLLEELKKLGFQDYTSFMVYALNNQIENRCKAMSKLLPESLLHANEIHQVFVKVIESAKEVMGTYKDSKYLPLNLEIQSTVIGSEAKQLSVVANQYQKMMESINVEIINFETNAKEVVKKIEMGQFYIGAKQLMKDVIAFLESESDVKEVEHHIQDLRFLSGFYLKKSEEGTREIIAVLADFKKTCESLLNTGAALEIVRITGKIEVSRLNQVSEINNLLLELKKFQTNLSRDLKRILVHQEAVRKKSETLLETIQNDME